MTKEYRLLFLVFLTYSIYAASIYINQGAFIFPFPLNELVVFIATMQFAYWNRTKRELSIAFILLGILALAKAQPVWEIFLSSESLRLFYDSIWVDVFILVYSIIVVAIALLITLSQKTLVNVLLFTVFIALYTFALIYNSLILYLLAYSFMVISSYVPKKNLGYPPLWILLILLESFKAISLWLND